MTGSDQTTKPVTRILIVDDHPLVREGLASRIARQPDMEVCGEAADVAQALEQVHATLPDLVIVDIALPDSPGTDLVKTIKRRYPTIKMLVVSAYDESLYAERCLRAGAQGYINKREVQEKVIDALRAVLQGHRYLSPKMTEQLVGYAIGEHAPAQSDLVHCLSDRELEVFRLIGQGKTTSAIARQLHLSIHTIDTHREKIRHKLGVENSNELMMRAVKWVLENG